MEVRERVPPDRRYRVVWRSPTREHGPDEGSRQLEAVVTLDIDAAMKRAAKNGLLSLTVHMLATGEWEVAYRNTDNTAVRVVKHADPAQALYDALRRGAGDATVKPSRGRDLSDVI